MRVLYVDHGSRVSGAQRALLDLVVALPPHVQPLVMCPRGELADLVQRCGIEVIEFPGTSGSLRLGPWRTAKAAREILASAVALRRAARKARVDVVHANSIRAGLIAGCARIAGGVPTVVHIHDALPQSRSANTVRRVIRATADAVITISAYTERNFGASRQGSHVLYNPLDVARFDPAAVTKTDARRALGVEQGAKLAGMVAQITPWKGQDTAIRAFALVRDRHPDARLLLVGESKFVDKATRYDNPSFEDWLRKLVRALDLEQHVEFCGEREDVVTIMRALDVLLAPSWEEPFGRSVIEGMALETAVIATNVGGPAEYIEQGIDGLLLPPNRVDQWAVALDRLLRDAQLRDGLATRGSTKVRRLFDRRKYASDVVEVYEEITLGPARPRRWGPRRDRRADLGEAVVP